MITQFTSKAFDQVRIYVNDQQVEHNLRNQFTDFPEIENGQWVRVTDFTVVKGIGRKLQEALLQAEFRTWAQIADATDLTNIHGIGEDKAAALKAHAQTVDPKGTWKTRWGYIPVANGPMALYRAWLENQINRKYGSVSEQIETLADLDEAGHRIVIESPFGEGEFIEKGVRWVQKNRPVVEAPKPIGKPVTSGQWDHLGYDEQPRTRRLDVNRVVKIQHHLVKSDEPCYDYAYITETDANITAFAPETSEFIWLGRFNVGIWSEIITQDGGHTGTYRRHRTHWFRPDHKWEEQKFGGMYTVYPVDTDEAADWLWEHGAYIEKFMNEYILDDRDEHRPVNIRPSYRTVERWDGTGFNEIEEVRRTERHIGTGGTFQEEWYEREEQITLETAAEMSDRITEEFDGIQATWTMSTRRDWAGESIIARPVFKKRQAEDGTWTFYMKHQDPRANGRQRNWTRLSKKAIIAQYKYHERMTRTLFAPEHHLPETIAAPGYDPSRLANLYRRQRGLPQAASVRSETLRTLERQRINARIERARQM